MILCDIRIAGRLLSARNTFFLSMKI